MLVVDSSVLVELLVGRPPRADLRHRLSGSTWHVPHLADIEVLHVLRGLVLRGAIAGERAEEATADYERLQLTRYPHTGFLGRVWALRGNLTAYDATFVALAELLGAPLITMDARIAAAPVHHAEVEVFS